MCIFYSMMTGVFLLLLEVERVLYYHLKSDHKYNWLISYWSLYIKREQEACPGWKWELRCLAELKAKLWGEGRGARQGSRCEPASLAACLHFSTNGSVFLTFACFLSLCRCWRVGEEHHCEADEVSDCSLFCFSSHHLWQINIWFNSTI